MRIYRGIVRQAWDALWRNPVLWIFGLFAALAGNGGEFTALANTVDRISNQASFLGTLESAAATNRVAIVVHNLFLNIIRYPLITLWLMFLAAVTTLLIVWVVIVAQVALIRSGNALAQGKSINFADALGAGAQHFWSVFWLNTVLRFATYLAFTAALLPFLFYYIVHPGSGWSFNGVMLLSYLIFVPIAIMLSFITKYAAMYVVLNGEKWLEAIAKAINLFFRNWLVSIEMALLMLAINFCISILLAIFLIPDTLALGFSVIGAQVNAAVAIRLMLTFASFLAVGAWFSTFQYLAWTFLFRKLSAGGVVAKLIRLTNEVPSLGWLQPATLGAGKPRRKR